MPRAAGLLGGERRRDAGPLGVHLLGLAEADHQRPPRLLGMDRRQLAVGALGVGGARGAGQAGRELLALVEADDQEVGLDLGDIHLSRFHLHRGASLCGCARNQTRPPGIFSR